MRKKWIAALLSVAMVLSLLTGCGASGSKATSGSIAGTYEGTGNGRNGDIVVAVTLDDNAAITNIEVKEQQETEGVGDIAFDQMIPQMVEHNTIAVDAVATATITSNGLLEAVRNALTAAGVNPDDYNGEVAATTGEDTAYDVDVAVVGAGGAGMAAAAAAAENGASVLVLEKAAAIGGNTKLGEGTYNVADSARQKQLTMTADNCKEVEAALSATTDDPEYQALLDATIGQRCDDFGRALGAQRDDEPKGPAHFDAVWVHRPAVEVFGLALHQRCPAGGRQLRHLQLFCEGQFLLGLAQTGPILALIKHGAAQIAFQRQPPGLQLLLQHHRLCKALDQLEHRRQIVGDQNLRFQREFCLDGAVCARLRQGIPKNLQFHAVCSFPCPSLLERYAPAGCRMPQKREHRQNTVLPCKKSVFPED